ncbi:FAD:protein FMN transferase [Caenispirillum bisanense]|uniref:FAD:protein FMN transferase n=1 Tax=Caenispirillum bisanense TaxID=414052 RepID=UPI0031D6D69A
MTALSRRRLLVIAAGTAAIAAAVAAAAAALADAGLRRWKGVALGGAAEMILPAEALPLLPRLQAEIARLEAVFSLYRPDSALSRLNAAGRLEAPPLELVDLMGRARAVSALTGGAFDVTVQPLWSLHARHARAGTRPAAAELGAARALVDWQAVSVAPDAVRFARPGMAVTLNGIAQGYITDRVADLLRREGLTEVLVSLGETRALGAHPSGRPWQVAPAEGAAPLPLSGGALATTAAAGTRIDPRGHLLDPRTGLPGGEGLRVTVAATTATTADALSTALPLLPAAERARVLAAGGATAAWIDDGHGVVRL